MSLILDDQLTSEPYSQPPPESPSHLTSESPSQSPPSSKSSKVPLPTEDAGDNTLLYGGLVVFIAALMLCVAVYLAYHNKHKVRYDHVPSTAHHSLLSS